MTSGSEARKALVDTSAYYAMADRGDSFHQRSLEAAKRLAVDHWRMFSTNLILAETHALLLNRAGRQIALRTLRNIRSGAVTIIRVSASDEEEAWDILENYQDKDFSFTDAASFVVMRRFNISHAFTFEHNFTQYGIATVV